MCRSEAVLRLDGVDMRMPGGGEARTIRDTKAWIRGSARVGLPGSAGARMGRRRKQGMMDSAHVRESMSIVTQAKRDSTFW